MPAKARRARASDYDQRREQRDAQGRAYIEVPALPPARRLIVESYPDLECADCSVPIRHGTDRHYVRAAQPTDVVEPVCAACGDRLLEV
jgi:hypothetical protein